MFDDLQQGVSQKDLEQEIKELHEVLRETRDWMHDKQSECDTLKKLYNESFTDAKRFSRVLKDVHQIIKDKKLEKEFENTGLDGVVNE